MRSDLLAPLFTGPSENDPLLGALLAVEGALATASARVGVVPAEAAAAIVAVCRNNDFHGDALGRAAVAAGNPVVPLVRAIEAELPPSARPWVHYGATSQDVLDTALMLVADAERGRITTALRSTSNALALLAENHRRTLTVARTLGQQALPTTFGLKAAGWLLATDAAAARLRRVRPAAQLGGAGGTLAAFGDRGLAVVAAFAAELGLAEPVAPWHTDRQLVLELAGALAAVAAALGKLALDLTLLAQTEVAEVTPATGGGSSAMPHKRNPVDAILVRTAAVRAPGLLATLHTAAALQEHERAAGGWHAEWEPLRELLAIVGGAATRAAGMVPALRVDADRMRATLDASGGLLLTERVAGVLAGRLGRSAAHDLVKATVEAGGSLREELLARTDLSAEELDEALDPAGYLGCADALLDRALATHARAETPEQP